MNRKSKAEAEIELRPDGWARFETAVGAAVMSGPKHRPVAKPASAKKRARPKGAKPR